MKTKGISPLLAAVILVALTISVAFIASSTISTLTQKQATTASQQGAASSNVLVVRDIDCKNQTPTSNVTISFILQNVGPQQINGIYVAYKIGRNTGSKENSVSLTEGGIEPVEIDTGINATDLTAADKLTYLQVCSKSPAGVCVERTDLSETCS